MKITKFMITDYWSYIEYHQNPAIFGYTNNKYLSKPPNRCLYSFGSYLLPFRCYNQIRKHLMSRSWWVYMRASTQWNTRKLIVTKGKGNPAMCWFHRCLHTNPFKQCKSEIEEWLHHQCLYVKNNWYLTKWWYYCAS